MSQYYTVTSLAVEALQAWIIAGVRAIKLEDCWSDYKQVKPVGGPYASPIAYVALPASTHTCSQVEGACLRSSMMWSTFPWLLRNLPRSGAFAWKVLGKVGYHSGISPS